MGSALHCAQQQALSCRLVSAQTPSLLCRTQWPAQSCCRGPPPSSFARLLPDTDDHLNSGCNLSNRPKRRARMLAMFSMFSGYAMGFRLAPYASPSELHHLDSGWDLAFTNTMPATRPTRMLARFSMFQGTLKATRPIMATGILFRLPTRL